MAICRSCDIEFELAASRCPHCGSSPAPPAAVAVAPARAVIDAGGPPGAEAVGVTGGRTGAAAEPSSANTGETADESAELRSAYRAKRIRSKKLKAPLKWLIRVAFAQIGLVAILLAAHKIPQPLVDSAVPDPAGGTFAVPLAVFIVAAVSIAAAYWFGLAGALRIHPRAGIPIAALITWPLADMPISSLRLGGTTISATLSDAGLRWAQLAVLAVFWVRLAASALGRRRARRAGPAPAVDPRAQPWDRGIAWFALACVLVYYGLEIAIWALYAQAGEPAAGAGSLLGDLGVQAILLPVFLVFVVLKGSTDLLEWGEIAVQSAVAGKKRRPPRRLLVLLIAVTAVASLANVIRLDDLNILGELAVFGVPALGLAALARLAPGYGSWSGGARSRAVTTGAIAVFLFTSILWAVTSAIRAAIGWPEQVDITFYALVATPVVLAALTVGLVLLARGTPGATGTAEQRGRGLLLVIAGALLIIGIPAMLRAGGWPAVFPGQRFFRLDGVQAVASLGSLGWLMSLPFRTSKPPAAHLRAVLALLAGLLLVSGILSLLNGLAALGASSDAALAGVFFLTVMWSFAMSGEDSSGEEANSAAYPRDGRILFLVGTTLASNATLLYLGTLRVPGSSSAALPDYLTADPVTPLGLAVLGSALVIVAFIARTAGRPGSAAPAPAAPAPAAAAPAAAGPARRTAQAVIAGAGIAATGTAVVILGSALPGLARTSAQLLSAGYTAPVPGPGCDTQGALWTTTPGEPITTTCTVSGMRVGIGPGSGRSGAVKFLPPDGFRTQNYRISVTVTLGSGFRGCAGILTRASASGRYLTYVCGDTSAGIQEQGERGVPGIRLYFVPRKTAYTIEAVSRDAAQDIYVDGVRLGTATDAAFTRTEYVGLEVLNDADEPAGAAATFSAFTYTPLPAARP